MVEIYWVALLASGVFLVHLVLHFLLFRSGIYWDSDSTTNSPSAVSRIAADVELNALRARMKIEGRESELRAGRAMHGDARERASLLADARTALSRVAPGERRVRAEGGERRAESMRMLSRFRSDLLILVCLGIGLALLAAGAE